ncbi:THUMP domain-containing protein [bacterium]|nr:THUMP domain-containing protein [bacterium]
MTEYYLSHVGGLESVVRDEVAERLPEARVTGAEYGRLHLVFPGEPVRLLELRTVENVFVTVLAIPEVSPRVQWLDDVEGLLARTDFGPAAALLGRLRPLPPSPTFRVTAERVGRHEFHSPDVAGAAGAGVVASTGWGVDLKGFDIEVRVDVRQDQALVGVRLSQRALHKRSRVVHPRVTLNPTVAAAMARLSLPEAGELVVDPTVGGGTVLTERYLHDPRVRLIGGDRFAEKLAMARENFTALGVPAELVQWDASRLPLADETVDKFLLNPPWGRLVASHTANERLYPWMLGHLRRCLRPGGRVVILTSERSLVRKFRESCPDMRLVVHQRLSLGGLEPSLHVLVKEA